MTRANLFETLVNEKRSMKFSEEVGGPAAVDGDVSSRFLRETPEFLSEALRFIYEHVPIIQNLFEFRRVRVNFRGGTVDRYERRM